jgi:energy-coupling factor transport system ATP-binding protein
LRDSQSGGDKGGSSIRVEGLRFSYGGAEVEALRGIDLDLRQGEFHAILGRNGSGKSTLARCMNALLAPSGGRVLSCGFDSSSAHDRREIHRRVAMVFQDPDTQMVGSTVEEEVAFGPENLGLPPSEIKSRVEGALERVGIPHLAGRQPGRLSQGQKQLVAIAGALAMEPVFLISDESTSMLDYRSRRNVIDLFMKLTTFGIGIVHVTHFLEEAALADSVVILDGGEVAGLGAPAEVLGDPVRLRELGLDPLAVTVIAYELGRIGHPVPGDVMDVKELVSWLYA